MSVLNILRPILTLAIEIQAVILMLLAMAVGTTIRLILVRRAPAETARQRRASLWTWWGLALGLSIAVLGGLLGICLLLGLASWLAFGEYRDLVARRSGDRLAVHLVLGTIPVVYGAVYLGHGQVALAFLPMAILLMVAAAQIWHGETHGYVRSTGGLVYGAVFLIFGLAHAAMLATVPADAGAATGSMGWFLYVVFLTETNDIAQALVGRRIGRRKITPTVSPHKTWEGFAGGALVTIVLAMALAPLLTPLADRLAPAWLPAAVARWYWPLLSGIVIVLTGFLGDLNMSAVKRDAGVKDSSDRLPGMGGVLDRVDSLTLTAPSFYYLIVATAA